MNGHALRALRKACGMTQEELASLAGINPITLHNWETEPCNPRMKEFSRVAGVLGLKAWELLKEMDDHDG